MKTLPTQLRPSVIPLGIRKVRALPTWLIVYGTRPFLKKSHPWKNRRFTLLDWYLGETELSRDMDFSLWTTIPWFFCMPVLVLFR